MDALAPPDERRPLRTAKSCGPVVQHFFAFGQNRVNREVPVVYWGLRGPKKKPAPNEAGPNRP
jgi:hypothetical protein